MMRGVMRAPAIASVALLLLCGARIAAAHDGSACRTNPPAAVVSARAALAAAANSLEARFTLADTLVNANCYEEAVHTLEEGEAMHPRSADLQAKLRTMRSLASEQTYFAGLEQAEVAARVSRNLLRCNRLGDLSACDEALKLKPNDVDILVAKGDAQLAAGKPADAEITFRRATQLAPAHARAAAQLAAAQAQRQAALSTCQKGAGDAALAACQVALLRGAEDEFSVHTRVAQLNQQRNQPAAALTSYIAANTLKPGDRNVALGIVALTDAVSQRDAVAWSARGSALLTLNRGSDALVALKQAQSLAPSMPDLRAQIARAEKLARSQDRRRVEASADAGQVAQTSATAAPARRYSNQAEASRSN
jgi:hypothetical protein